jgi:hypothetical protein
MTGRRTLRNWMVRLTAIAVLVASFGLGGGAPAAAASNRLENGRKLTAGHCIRDVGGGREARFCVGHYSKINLIYRGRTCWSWQASGGSYRPSAFVRVARNGDVEFYPYSGGRRLWHSGTVYFPRADLVVGSHLYGKAILAVDTGTAFFTFRSCR